MGVYGTERSPEHPSVAAVLAVVGDLLEDIVVHLPSTPALGTDTSARIERRRGGSAANVAACAAQAGVPVRFIGSVGDDDLGDRLVGDLAADGVDVRVQRRDRTGSVVVLVGPDGERTMLPDRAAAMMLADVDARWLDGVTWLHVPSYSLLSEPIGSSVLAMIKAARLRGVKVSVDVSSVAVVEQFGVQRYTSLLDELAPEVVFANEPEARLLPRSALSLVIVKDGPRPVRVRGPAGQLTVDVPATDVADSTGAGDAFAAGYLAATIRGDEIAAAVAAGIELAARVLRR